jgi:hypothetical protein
MQRVISDSNKTKQQTTFRIALKDKLLGEIEKDVM